VGDEVMFKIYNVRGTITINLNTYYDGNEFTFNELDSKFPGMLCANSHFMGYGTAIDYSLVDDKWIARIGVN
jgi:hypothetical protein